MIQSLNNYKPKIHPTVFVSKQAYIVGRVEIGEGSSVWPGAVIRADTAEIKIGKFVNIQDNAVIHADEDALYGDYITIGHGAISHAKRVGNYVLIGNGAVVNDGVEIGEFSIIASGAVVLENTKIPPYSLVVGIPAQVKSKVKDKHIELIKKRAKEYAKKAEVYRAAGLGEGER